MGLSDVINPLIQKTLRLLGLAIPLSILALMSIMLVQAYNEMAALEVEGNLQIVTSLIETETGGLPQATLRGR